jgi:hypothetical protein
MAVPGRHEHSVADCRKFHEAGRHHQNVNHGGCMGKTSWLSVLFVFLIIITYVPKLSLALPNVLF